MKRFQRALVGVYSLLIAILALVVLLVVLGWHQPLNYLQIILTQQQPRIITALVAAIIFLLTAKLFFDSFRPVQITQAPIQSTQLGEINVTIHALENMIKNSVQSINGIYNVKPEIKSTPKGLAVFIKVQMEPERNIPQVTSDMQLAIKEYLGTYAGVELVEVRVLVDDTPKDIKTRVE